MTLCIVEVTFCPIVHLEDSQSIFVFSWCFFSPFTKIKTLCLKLGHDQFQHLPSSLFDQLWTGLLTVSFSYHK